MFSITEKANKLYPPYILRGSINERRKNEIIAKNIPSFFEYNFVASGLIEIQKIKSPEKCRALAESEGFEPPDALTSTVFKFYPASVVCRLLLLFNSPNCRKISVLTALLSDNSGFLLCFGIVSRSLSLLIFSIFLSAFCRDFVDCFAWIKKFICCFILFLFLTNTRHGAKQIFAYQSNQESV